MEKHRNSFDDFLKEALKGHQLVPREKAKKAFLEEASAELRIRRGWKYWPYLVATILVITTLTAIFIFRSNEKQTMPENAISAHQPERPVSPAPVPASADQSSTASSPSSNPASPQAAANFSSSSLPSSSPATSIATSIFAVNANNDASVSKNQSGKLTPALNESQSDSVNSASINIFPENGQPAVSTVSSAQTGDSLAVPVKNNAEPDKKYVLPLLDTLANTEPAGERKGTAQGPVYKAPYFTAGIYAVPEWIFNSADEKKYINFYGIEGAYHFGQYSVTTGVGISIFRGEVENAVEYKEYLGSYEKLDSITFNFSESENDFIPSLYLSSQKVWDSLAKFDSTKISLRYTYLQVPVVFGYDFWQRGILNMGVRFGAVMSVLLDSKQLSDGYDPGQNIVIGINRLTPEKVSMSWQFTGGINASATLAKNICLDVEPIAKYYYQPFYENSAGSGKPWSVGIRIAINYKF